MASGRRLLSIWFAFHLSVGIGLMGVTNALLRGTEVSQGIPLVIGAAGALMAAYVLLRRFPELKSGVVWRCGFLTTVLFIFGNVVTPNGIYSPTGESSPLTIGLLWLVAMAVAYGVSVRGGYAWLLNRLVSR